MLVDSFFQNLLPQMKIIIVTIGYIVLSYIIFMIISWITSLYHLLSLHQFTRTASKKLPVYVDYRPPNRIPITVVRKYTGSSVVRLNNKHDMIDMKMSNSQTYETIMLPYCFNIGSQGATSTVSRPPRPCWATCWTYYCLWQLRY